jgi:hypothetical protein
MHKDKDELSQVGKLEEEAPHVKKWRKPRITKLGNDRSEGAKSSAAMETAFSGAS